MSEMTSRKQSGTLTCPKCGMNFRSFRVDKIVCPKCKTRSIIIGKREIYIALGVIAVILLVLIGLFAPPHESNTNSASDSASELEREEIRSKRDAFQPILREGCLQGNQEACRQYKKWENIR